MRASSPERALATTFVKGLATESAAVSWVVLGWAAVNLPINAYAQSPAESGFAAVKPPPVDTVKQIADAVAAALAYPIYGLVAAWFYIIEHTAAATLLTAAVAGFIAITSIRATRSIARLRETFTAYSNDNWDKDVIKAKYVFTAIKRGCINNPQIMASYFEALPDRDFSEISDNEERRKKIEQYRESQEKHEEAVVTLRTIANDYENKALAIRFGILDEPYAYRYSRSGVLKDWQSLSPLVAAYRFRLNNHQLFIEFEGLANSWSQGQSFRTGKKLRPSKKRTVFT